jgi:hypothetical protein
MPAPIQPSTPPVRVACSVCRKEIPLSSALTPQGAEYVGYFCGIECYEEFMAEQKSGKPENTPQTQK